MLNRRAVACAVLLRLALYTFLYFSMGIARSGTGLLGKRFGEEEFYFDSISNLIAHGQYNYTLNHLPGYAGRMPGYGLIYGLFIMIFPDNAIADYNGVIATQLLLGTIAMIYLGKILFLLTKNIKLCSIFLIVYALSAYSIQTDMFLFTESFAASALVFSTYCFLQALSSDRLFYYFLSGCWLSWVVFLRPFMLPFFAVWLAVYAYYHRHRLVKRLRRVLYTAVLFMLPFLLPDAAWTIRNWTIYHQLIPLQTQYAGMQYSDLFLESRSFASALGEEPVVWSPHSLLTWLTRPTAPPETAPRAWQLTKYGTYDSLIWLRSQILISKNDSLPTATRNYSEKQAVSALRRFRVAFINEHPFIYYVVAPLRLTYYLALTDSGASVFAWPFNELTSWQKVIRLYFSAAHWFWMCAGLFSFFYWTRRPNAKILLIRLAPIYLIILFVIIIRHVEYRYFFLVYPLTLLSGFHTVAQLAKRVAPGLFTASK